MLLFIFHVVCFSSYLFLSFPFLCIPNIKYLPRTQTALGFSLSLWFDTFHVTVGKSSAWKSGAQRFNAGSITNRRMELTLLRRLCQGHL